MFGLCGYHCVSHHLYLCPCSVCSVCDAYGACRISYGACRISCSVCRASCGVSNTCRAYSACSVCRSSVGGGGKGCSCV